MSKNPHAVALGRKGGKAKGKPKGFAAMSKERADYIRKMARARLLVLRCPKNPDPLPMGGFIVPKDR